MLVRRGKSRPLLSIWHRLLLLGNGRLFIQNESGVLVSFKKPRGIMCNATFGIVSLWQARSIMKYPWRSSQGACFLVHDTEWLLFAGNSSASYRNWSTSFCWLVWREGTDGWPRTFWWDASYVWKAGEIGGSVLVDDIVTAYCGFGAPVVECFGMRHTTMETCTFSMNSQTIWQMSATYFAA